MIGARAALIVQAEEHINNAIRELRISKDRLVSLSNLVSDSTRDKLLTIAEDLDNRMLTLDAHDFQFQLRNLWDAD